MEPIKVLLVDNEEVFREGLVKLLKDQPHIEIVYQCSSGKEAIEKSNETKPDVVLMSSQISDFDALEAVKEIKKNSPDIRVAMITRLGEGPNPLQILKSGARGYLAKTISAADLVKTIELISSGRIIIGHEFAKSFLDEIDSAEEVDSIEAAETKSSLSEREIEIAVLITEGYTNKEIAQILFIAENTVKVHVKNILKKLELRNRQQLVAYTVLQNWMTDPSIQEEDLQVDE
jgi:DNA-binding NarL/FixJ family response regulator